MMLLADTSNTPFLIGVSIAVLPTVAGAVFVARRTKAEATSIITEAAARIVQLHEARAKDLEARLVAAETKLALAMQAESECKSRLSKVEARLDLVLRNSTTTIEPMEGNHQ
jgi:phosphoribosylanthranilate isomerase